jgi:hypothetical protein
MGIEGREKRKALLLRRTDGKSELAIVGLANRQPQAGWFQCPGVQAINRNFLLARMDAKPENADRLYGIFPM